ncbi:MAG: ABC transporter permease, partial [Gemmatimonadales bacterium]
MKLPFVARMALREGRASHRRFVLYTAAITAGVAALVAIGSFRISVIRSVRAQALTVLGADLELRRRNGFPDTVQAVIDSVAAAGVPITRTVDFGSMVRGPSGQPRLLQIRAIEGGFPYYGNVTSEPAAAWPDFQSGKFAVVDRAVLVYLNAVVGDTIAVGQARFVVAGFLTDFPGDLGIQTAIGPRVFIPLRFLEATRLIRFGSISTHRAYFRTGSLEAAQSIVDGHSAMFDEWRVRWDTVEEVEEDLSSALGGLAKFLALVGLVALILGGIGVASAVNVFVNEKLDSIAVLRCLGAKQRTVFGIYLFQSILLALGGSAAGIVIGLSLQYVFPIVLADFLPLDVGVAFHIPTIASGLLIGVWIALIFSLLPLLQVRNVSPLQALRRNYATTAPRRDIWRLVTFAALAAGVFVVSVWQAPSRIVGLGFAGGLGVTTALLAVAAWGIVKGTKRFFPKRARYVVRQGIANLFRPHNQTVSVTLALGFGVFLIVTLNVVQSSLLSQLRVDSNPDRPNIALFDIQLDQRDGVLQLMRDRGFPDMGTVPIVPSRIAAINGRTVADILDDPELGPNRWMYTREYRNTYRDTLNHSEVLTAGAWFPDVATATLPRISVDEDIAEGFGVGLGDTLTWDIQGVELATVITSLRRINWARFEPNFFVIFEPGVLENAPQTTIYLTREDDPVASAEAQRAMVDAFPNVSILDLTNVQRTIDEVVGKVTFAV